MTMRFTVLGSNATYPTRGQAASGYLVENGARAVLLDAGPGSVSELLNRIDIAHLEAVVISHEHADHCADVAALYFRMRYGPEALDRFPLVAPQGVFGRLETFLTYSPVGEGFREAFEDRVVEGGDSLDLIGATWSFHTTDHPVPSVATRIDGLQASLTYTSDTGPDVDLMPLASGTDVLVAEATFQGNDTLGTQHLTARMAGALAAQVKPGLLILTHIRPDLNPAESVAQAAEIFGGEIRSAYPGMEINL